MVAVIFLGVRGRSISAWFRNPSTIGQPARIRIYLDNRPILEGTADWFDGDASPVEFSDGCCGFNVMLPESEIDGREASVAIGYADGSSDIFFSQKVRLPDLTFRPLPPPSVVSPVAVSICAIVRNELPYLLEWLAWHRLIGVQRFHIFDNNSDDGTTIMLAALARAGLVDHVVWPDVENDGAQIAAYMAGQGRIGLNSRWVAFIDADEFLHPLRGEWLPDILSDYESAGGLVVPWRFFGSNFHEQKQDDLVVSRFTRRASDADPVNSMVKTIVQTRALDRPGIHTSTLREGNLVDETGHVAGRWGHPDNHRVPSASRLVLNHYFCKSKEEWNYKKARGKADKLRGSKRAYRPDSDFTGHDRNEIEDTGIAQRADEIKREIQRLVSAMR